MLHEVSYWPEYKMTPSQILAMEKQWFLKVYFAVYDNTTL
jgi:hypothetical protein